MENKSEFKAWSNMKTRCYNPNWRDFHRYGGRGITVCKEWRTDFKMFLKDVGVKPFLSFQLDRIDNDGNYCPNNCRWVSPKENAKNRSTTKLSFGLAESIRTEYLRGGTTQKQLADTFGVSPITIYRVIKNKQWSVKNG